MATKWTNRTLLGLLAVAAAAGVVMVLAVLQFQWTAEISHTEQQRLKDSLDYDVSNFNREFSYDFERLSEAFLVAPEFPESNLDSRVQGLYSNWRQTAAVPSLVAGVYISKFGGAGDSALESFDASSGRVQEVPWPPEFDSLRRWILQQSAQNLEVGDREAVYYPWTLAEDVPALVRPIFQIAVSPRSSGGKAYDESRVMPAGFLIVGLNRDFLQRQYFPDLVDRQFGSAGQRSFGVAIRGAQTPRAVFYASDPSLLSASSTPDAAINLLDPISEEARRRGRPAWQPLPPGNPWQLVVQHPAGSLEEAVIAWRRRSLAISFTLLAALAASMLLIWSVSRREQRLAQLQIEFVTGVSHELCTPLAVINSAAENLADGVVAESAQIQEYGGLIRDQGRRLERLVDQVLQFAAERAGRARYEPRPLDLSAVLAQSLLASEPILREAGFTVEKDIVAHLPLVVADPAAIGRCIDNLLSNAMKYSVDDRWIAVRARVATSEVQLSVEDRGLGIPAVDLPHVFEPFYRVRSAREGPIRGVGLGLYLVKRMMEAMGGGVTVRSESGRGSSFTLHFPIFNPARQVFSPAHPRESGAA